MSTPYEKWSAIEALLRQHWHQPDIEAVKIQLACLAGQYLTDAPPAWCMAIAPSGSAKTVILEALHGLSDFHLIDQVTKTTFISGKFEDDGGNLKARAKRKEDKKRADAARKIGAIKNNKHPESASFLQRIGNNATIAIADFSTILTMHESARNEIFSQMRRIYDGRLHREFGTAENIDEREWAGRITMLVAVTPEVDRYSKMFSALGDRFLRVRWPRAGGAKAMRAAVNQTQGVLAELKRLAHELMSSFILQPDKTLPVVPSAMCEQIGELSEFVCHARTYVHWKGTELDGEPVVESNTRLPQQLCQLARGWHALMGEKTVSAEGIRLVWRVAWDCMPPARKAVLEGLRDGKGVYSSYISPDTLSRATADLAVLGLLATPSMGITKVALTPMAKELLERAGNEPSEKLS